MNGFLFDSNVLLDIVNLDSTWRVWSEAQVVMAIERGAANINPIIYSEISPAFTSQGALDDWLDRAPFGRLTLPYEAGWRASTAFMQYRRAGGPRLTPLPDFYIGAHAETANLTLATRDTARFATYFPQVTLLVP